MNPIRFFSIIILVIIFASCGDKKVFDVYTIDNNSNDTIVVLYDAKESHEQSFENLITVKIAPRSEIVFYTGRSSTFSPINENDDYLLAFDTLQIQSSTGELKKDFQNPQNWNYKKKWKFLRDYKTHFKFIIEDKDIAR